MAILGLTKPQVDAQLGKPVFAQNLLGLSQSGEKAWAYGMGDYKVIVGLMGGVARYVAVVRQRGPMTAFSPAEIGVILALNAPASLWSVTEGEVVDDKKKEPKKPKSRAIRVPPSQYFRYVERDPKVKEKVLREFHGWMPGGKSHAFFIEPSADGQPPLLVSEWGVSQALP